MSQLTHPRAQIVDLSFRARTWLAALAAVIVVAIPAALIVAPSDSTPADQASAGALRYDGGPNEGTRGLAAQDSTQAASTRGSDTFGGPRP